MKKSVVISVILLLFASSDLFAQRYPQAEKEANLEARTSLTGLYQKNSSIWLDGNKLNKQELSGMEGFDFDLYSKGRTKVVTGTSLMAVGAVPCALAIGTFAGALEKKKSGAYSIAGPGPGLVILVSGGLGLALEAVGITLHCTGKADIRHAAISYNGQKSIKYSLGPATSGFGIALNF